MNATHKYSVFSPFALGGFTTSALALFLALIGAHGPAPFGAIEIPLKLRTGGTAILVYGGTFILPIFLGLLGAGMGAYAFQSIERSEGRMKGNGPAVFSVFLGLFAVIIATLCTFAVLIYPVLFDTGMGTREIMK